MLPAKLVLAASWEVVPAVVANLQEALVTTRRYGGYWHPLI